MFVQNEVSPAVDSVVSVAVVLFADRLVLPPAQPGPPVDDEAPLSVAGCQSQGRQEHDLWSERQEQRYNPAMILNLVLKLKNKNLCLKL